MKTFVAFAFAIAASGAAQVQTSIVANTSSGQTSLTFRTAMVTFVQSDAPGVSDAVKGTAISVARDKAVEAAAIHAIPIPVVGPYVAGPVVGKVMKAFHHDKPLTGFNVAFLPGLSAEAVVQRGETSFTIPGSALQGGHPVLVRVKPSSKDSARIVRSVHATVKMKDSKINPLATDNKVLGVDEDVIGCRQEVRGGDIILTPNSILEPGEYAVLIVPPQQDLMPITGSWVWDFRVM